MYLTSKISTVKDFALNIYNLKFKTQWKFPGLTAIILYLHGPLICLKEIFTSSQTYYKRILIIRH